MKSKTSSFLPMMGHILIERVDSKAKGNLCFPEIGQLIQEAEAIISKVHYPVLILLGLFISCSPRLPMPQLFPEDEVVIEFSDFYQAGQLQFENALSSRLELKKVWQGSRSEILLIMITIEDEDGERERIQQSGVYVLGGQYILTAAHGFFQDEAILVDLKAREVDGSEFPVEITRLHYQKKGWKIQDWAILHPISTVDTDGVYAPERSTFGGEVLMMGFPGSLGLNSKGIVVRAHEVGYEEVYPLGMICDQILIKPQTLRPVAGAIPIRGISGAPILDKNGGLIGLFSSVSRTRDGMDWQYIFGMTDIPWNTLDSLSGK